MRGKKLLHGLAKRAYRSKAFDLLTYIRSAHMNYVSFILTLINLAVIMMGIVLPALRVPPELRPAAAGATLAALLAVAVVLGWIDVNAGVTRKTVVKQAYWRRPTWQHVAMLTGRIYKLPDLTALWIRLRKGGELDSEAAECLSEAAKNTVYWAYIGNFDIKKEIKLPSKRCLKKFFEMAGVELSEEEVARVYELLKSPEYS
ncbi:MAG: hypothetical protein GXO07_06575 [Crenarchaeota archaeon]|nr:hypothetical protein [Thermoproteota archaeon]